MKINTSAAWKLLHERFDDVQRIAEHGPNLCDDGDDVLVLAVFNLITAELLIEQELGSKERSNGKT